ncbi:unnamed protein product [Zymoseptoria tritici ST99CH_3D7]|uniref:RNase III domain-containing protein n=1 Tax=Zymoseptoria tritici (strain ST99CH_3D7) TaxID=1276538 RepID=A0A1X7RVG9_ZYMT9|nr:unnamed protein product [Zymoseptoria tritici ST99CH_3D7]
MSTLEQELDLLGQSLKRKRSASSDSLDGQHHMRPPPNSGRVTARRDSVAGSCLEHPIDLDDDSEDAEAGILAALNLPREIIVIEDSDEDADISNTSISFSRSSRKRVRKRERLPERTRIPEPKRAAEPKMYTVLVMDDAKFLRSKALVEEVTRYSFKKAELIREALYPFKTAVIISDKLIKSGNWRLAILGDTVLKTALLDSRFGVNETLYETHIFGQDRGTNAALAEAARRHGLRDLLVPFIVSRDPSSKMLGTLVEAIIGAIWVDSDKDLAAVKRFLEVLYHIKLD